MHLSTFTAAVLPYHKIKAHVLLLTLTNGSQSSESDPSQDLKLEQGNRTANMSKMISGKSH